MKIAYSKKQLYVNLVLGLVWLVWSLVLTFTADHPKWTDYGWGVIGLLYLGLYLFQKHYKYLSIQNGTIKVNTPFGKQLKLSEVKRIKKFAGDYILKTDTNALTVNTRIIDPQSLVTFQSTLEKLEVEWE